MRPTSKTLLHALLTRGGLAIALVAAAVACSSSDAPSSSSSGGASSNEGASSSGGSSSGGSSSGSSSGGSSSGGSSSGSSGSSGGVKTDATCAAETSALACYTCCQDVHKKGGPIYDAALVGCFCDGVGARCAGSCAASLCTNRVFGQGKACNDCIDANRAACRTMATNSAACKGEADCAPYVACTSACPTK